MKVLKYITLTLILLNVPTFGLLYFGPSVGSISNALLFGFIIAYFFLNKKNKLPLPFFILGLLYFVISGINYSGIIDEYIKDIIRYFIYIIGIVELTKNSSDKELSVFLLIGAISVFINASVFPNDYGRYSGFYINPNRAGLVCLIGFALSYKLTNFKLRLIAQFLFIIGGIMTLSRYFILLLVLINLLSIISNKKNLIGLMAGVVAFLIVLTTASLQLNSDRFSALQSIFSNEEVDTETITKESREETWAKYTDVILDNLLVGNGYRATQGKDKGTVGIQSGVHNTYLMTIGESGIIPFLILIVIYIALVIRSIRHFAEHPEYVYLSLILLTFLLVSHNYFDNYIVLFFSIWLYKRVTSNSFLNQLNPID